MTQPDITQACYVFGQTAMAEAEFRARVPLGLDEDIAWSTLKREADAVADPERKEEEGDLLYSARMHSGEVVLLRLLLKKERTGADRGLEQRLMRYSGRQIRHWRRRHPGMKSPQMLISVVVYFGTQPLEASPGGDGLCVVTVLVNVDALLGGSGGPPGWLV
jgi:hypothetical protein